MSHSFSAKKISLTAGAVILATAVFAGCTGGSDTTPTTTQPTTEAGVTESGAPAADQKSGDTTKTGTITQNGEAFYLTEAGMTPKMVESYAVELGDYVGQVVTVTGQYSGDTLFIGKVE